MSDTPNAFHSVRGCHSLCGRRTANGALVDRATLLGVFTRDNPNSRFLIDELVIRDFGTAASVMGRLRTTTLAGGVVANSRYGHLYISRDKHWWIVNAVGSPVQKTPSRGE